MRLMIALVASATLMLAASDPQDPTGSCRAGTFQEIVMKCVPVFLLVVIVLAACTSGEHEARGTAQDFLSAILANGPALQTVAPNAGSATTNSTAPSARGQPHAPWLWALPQDAPADEGEPE